jgi:hypothetical protein
VFSEIYSAQADTFNDKMVINGTFSTLLDDSMASSFNILSYPIPESNFVATVDDLPAVD